LQQQNVKNEAAVNTPDNNQKADAAIVEPEIHALTTPKKPEKELALLPQEKPPVEVRSNRVEQKQQL